jgi:hypothetical protein
MTVIDTHARTVRWMLKLLSYKKCKRYDLSRSFPIIFTFTRVLCRKIFVAYLLVVNWFGNRRNSFWNFSSASILFFKTVTLSSLSLNQRFIEIEENDGKFHEQSKRGDSFEICWNALWLDVFQCRVLVRSKKANSLKCK